MSESVQTSDLDVSQEVEALGMEAPFLENKGKHEHRRSVLRAMVAEYGQDSKVLTEINRLHIKENDYHARAVDDDIRAYFNQISHYTLLTAADEQVLGEQLDNGIEAWEVLNSTYDIDETIHAQLEAIIKAGIIAKQTFYLCNLRLVVSIAKRYRGQGLEFMELIQEGNIGLDKGVTAFDHKRGFKFSTYGTHWIKQSITKAIADKSRVIRLPVHFHEKVFQVNKTTRKLESELGRVPTPAEISEDTGLALDTVIEALNHQEGSLLSLDQPVEFGSEKSSGPKELKDFIPEEVAESSLGRSLETLSAASDLETIIARANLSSKQKSILSYRFGIFFTDMIGVEVTFKKGVVSKYEQVFDSIFRDPQQNSGANSGKAATLDKIGEQCCLTRERIRQIETAAKIKLRKAAESLNLNS